MTFEIYFFGVLGAQVLKNSACITDTNERRRYGRSRHRATESVSVDRSRIVRGDHTSTKFILMTLELDKGLKKGFGFGSTKRSALTIYGFVSLVSARSTKISLRVEALRKNIYIYFFLINTGNQDYLLSTSCAHARDWQG